MLTMNTASLALKEVVNPVHVYGVIGNVSSTSVYHSCPWPLALVCERQIKMSMYMYMHMYIYIIHVLTCTCIHEYT